MENPLEKTLMKVLHSFETYQKKKVEHISQVKLLSALNLLKTKLFSISAIFWHKNVPHDDDFYWCENKFAPVVLLKKLFKVFSFRFSASSSFALFINEKEL